MHTFLIFLVAAPARDFLLLKTIMQVGFLNFCHFQICPICAALPGGDPNHVTDDFAAHLTLEHRAPRDLISFPKLRRNNRTIIVECIKEVNFGLNYSINIQCRHCPSE